jgi:hypothetical protein
MRNRGVGRLAALLAAGFGIAFSLPAGAQGNNVQNRGGGVTARRPAPKNYIGELRDLAESMGKQYQTRIVVDPAIFVTSKPVAPDANLAIEKAMDALAGQVKNTAWRRVYLKQGAGAALPALVKLADAVRSLDRVEQSGIVLENPATRRATTYVKDYAVSPSFKEELTNGQFSADPVYVLYSTGLAAGAGGTTPQERMQNLQREQMELMMQMDPDQVAQAMQQGMQMFMSLDPQTRSQFMGNMMRAGMQMFMNMPAEQRQELMQSIFQTFQQGGVFGGPGGPPGAPGPGRRP